MDTFADIIQIVQDDKTIGNESTLYPVALVKRAINRAYRKSGALFLWPATEDAKKTSTEANQEYYDYPTGWRDDSVWKLTVDDVDYGDPVVFKDYLFEQENDNPSGLTKMWSQQNRRYFIDPVPTTNGNYNISIWGQKVVDTLVNDTDTTIFSYSMPECNDAVAKEAVAILTSKGQDQNTALFISSEAKGILGVAWSKIKKEQQKYEKTTPMFNVPDFYGSRRNDTRNRIGNF